MLDRDYCFVVYCVDDDGLTLITMNTDTADSMLATVTAPVVDRLGWRTYSAMEQKPVS